MAAVNGIPALKRQLERFKQQKVKNLEGALVECGRMLLRESQQLVPADFGNLRASGGIRLDHDSKGNPIVFVYYTASYAIYVHENPDAAHGQEWNIKHEADLERYRSRPKKQRSPTSPYRHDRGPHQVYKFLETPFRRLRPQFMRIIRSRI